MINLICDVCNKVLIISILVGSTLLIVKGVIHLFCSFFPKCIRYNLRQYASKKTEYLFKYHTPNSKTNSTTNNQNIDQNNVSNDYKIGYSKGYSDGIKRGMNISANNINENNSNANIT